MNSKVACKQTKKVGKEHAREVGREQTDTADVEVQTLQCGELGGGEGQELCLLIERGTGCLLVPFVGIGGEEE